MGFAPCGERFATGSRYGAVVVWDAQTGEAEHRMQGSGTMDAPTGNAALCLTFSAGGARLACVNGTGSIDVWDVTTSALLLTIPAPHGFAPDPLTHCASVSFSPTDNRRLISAGVGRQIHLWDVDIGEKIRSIGGRQFAVFSPDGRSIATARAKRRRGCDVELVDAESGALVLRIVGHEGPVTCASFSEDGSKLASGSNGICNVWDSSTGALLRTINVDEDGGIETVAWGRDWVRDAKYSFAMGHHPRLGAGSQVLELEEGVVRMVLDHV